MWRISRWKCTSRSQHLAGLLALDLTAVIELKIVSWRLRISCFFVGVVFFSSAIAPNYPRQLSRFEESNIYVQ